MAERVFRCWDEVNGSEESARALRCREPRVAAETFAEIRWGDDYPQEQRICVRDDRGALHRFVARVEMVPAFTVRPVEESDG